SEGAVIKGINKFQIGEQQYDNTVKAIQFIKYRYCFV
uniref:Transposase n=1 Tax=Strongyloides papillosus TaxID=174720 RepID=A0A0N5CFP5_STREA